MMVWPFNKTPKLESYENGVPREVLIQSGRILFVDDEQLPIINQLSRGGFAVGHDTTGNDFERQVSNQTYDVAIVDYSGVGLKYGKGEGLDLLRHIRRVSPRTRIIAYTSKSLPSSQSDFFRSADAVLQKDAGITDSLAIIEDQLQRAFSKQHLFESLLKAIEVSSPRDRERIKRSLEMSLKEKDQARIKEKIKKVAGAVVDKGIDVVLARLFMS